MNAYFTLTNPQMDNNGMGIKLGWVPILGQKMCESLDWSYMDPIIQKKKEVNFLKCKPRMLWVKKERQKDSNN